MIERIEHTGMFLRECSFAGERRADDVFPGHANAIQVARKRFLVVYATRGYRGTDDDRSIVAQLRADDYDGPVIREIMLSRCIDDWDPQGNGQKLVRQHGHPVAFGVPQGARVDGHVAASAGVFVIKWRCNALWRDPTTGFVTHPPAHIDVGGFAQRVQWMQVRLNDALDDLEILASPAFLLQDGHATADRFCVHPLASMNQSFTQAVPLTRDGSAWIGVNHVHLPDGSARVMVLAFRFDAREGLYHWTDTGPLLDGGKAGIFEGCIAPWRGRWVLAARGRDEGNLWATVDDPLQDQVELVNPGHVPSNAPLSVYACADGVLRLITGDPKVSPYRNGRDPLYLWDIDPAAHYAASNRQVVFDCVQADVGIPQRQVPRVDMGKILPHAGGRVQHILHRVRSKATRDKAKTGMVITQAEMDAGGIYHARIVYDRDYPGMWSLEA